MILQVVRISTLAIWEHQNLICHRLLEGWLSSRKRSMFYSVRPVRKSYTLPLLCSRALRHTVRNICFELRPRGHEKRPLVLLCLFRQSIRLSVRMYQLSSNQVNFREIWYSELLLKLFKKIQIWLQSDKNIEHFTRKPKHIWLLPAT